MNKQTIKTVAIYARVSTGKQTSENQLRDLRSYCDREGWTVYDEYIDVESGGTADRTEFKRLFSDARHKQFDLVLFWALDRFSREGVRKTLKLLEQFDEYGVAYKSYTEQYIDSAGMFRDAIIAIVATLAKQERVRLSERTKAGLQRAKAKGKRLGKPPLPLSTKREIKRLRRKGLSIRKIANKAGVSVGSVSNVLKT